MLPSGPLDERPEFLGISCKEAGPLLRAERFSTRIASAGGVWGDPN